MKPAPLLDRIETLLEAQRWQVIADVEAWLEETAGERQTNEIAEVELFGLGTATNISRFGSIADVIADHICMPLPNTCGPWGGNTWIAAEAEGTDPCGWRTVSEAPDEVPAHRRDGWQR